MFCMSIVSDAHLIGDQVRWANKRKIPFLPYGGGHGINGGLGKVQNGIQISFAKMKDISLSKDGKSASVQPGLHSGELVRGLFALNKRTSMMDQDKKHRSNC